jgi:hypothetical protein
MLRINLKRGYLCVYFNFFRDNYFKLLQFFSLFLGCMSRLGIGFSFATDLHYCTAFFTRDNTGMYLKTHKRKKNGKYHEYYSISEKRNISRSRYVEKIVLYLGDISDSQKKSWQKSIEILNEDNKPIYKSLFQKRNYPGHKPLATAGCVVKYGISLALINSGRNVLIQQGRR